jgi:NADPH-dependent curcumin reductase CurA
MSDQRCWRLRCRPEGPIKDSDLELCTEPKPAPADGQLLVKNMFIRYRTGALPRRAKLLLSVAKRALTSSERRNARSA